jgi:hypothetical protein
MPQKALDTLSAIGFGVGALWLLSLLNVQSEGSPGNPYFAPTFLTGYIGVAFLAILCVVLAITSAKGKFSLALRVIALGVIVLAALIICRIY